MFLAAPAAHGAVSTVMLRSTCILRHWFGRPSESSRSFEKHIVARIVLDVSNRCAYTIANTVKAVLKFRRREKRKVI